MQPDANRMASHVRVIAIIDLVLGGIAGIGTVAILFAFLTGAGLFADEGQGGLSGFLVSLGLFLALIVGAFAALYIIAGILLLKRRPAGRGWGIAAAVPSLFSFPIGTAIGVYALVILNREETAHLFQAPGVAA